MKSVFTIIVSLVLIHTVRATNSTTITDSTRIPKSANTVIVHAKNSQDTTLVPVVIPVSIYQNVLVKRRLDSIKKDVPLDYNEYVQSYIDLYMQRKPDMARVLGLSKYYFPIYEKAFRDAGIPEEIKFLSIVESELNPNAVSRVGATGPWQFMFATGKVYGLNVDDYVDDRRDPIQASYAAAAYLKDAYQEFGDWLLAIASYNCGKSNVIRALEQANGATDFWSIRQYLPVETRGYVPAYIAMSYVMNYYKRHNIVPQPCDFSLKNDTVLVNKYVSLNSVSKVLGVELRQMAILNPSYKRMIINGTPRSPKRMVIPQTIKEKYAALYNALNNDGAIPSAPQTQEKIVSYADTKPEDKPIPAYHTVRHGETLADVADSYGIEVENLKAWNHLHSNKAITGTRLKLNDGATDKTESVKSSASKYVTYKVRRGDTISSVADKFDGATIEKIKELNGLKSGHLQPGMTLKITRI